MQCSRCKFENMPGQKTCFRCGSVLEDSQVTVEVHPPRAPAWKKPFRRVKRRVRHLRTVRRLGKAADGVAVGTLNALGIQRVRKDSKEWLEFKEAMGWMIVGLIASAIPGLAQIIQGRFRAIWYYCLVWLVLMAGGVYLYGPGLGTILLALAIVVHAWIAADGAMLLKLVKRLPFYLMSVAALSAAVFIFYMTLNNLVLGGMELGWAGVSVPFHGVELRDRILCRRLSEDMSSLQRGDMVLVSGVGRIRRGGYLGRIRAFELIRFLENFRGGGETVGQVVGMPGDVVQIKDRGFVVNESSLDPDEFPLPLWLHRVSLNVRLKEGEYFVTMEYTGPHGVRQLVNDACVIPRSRLAARGFMLWLPVSRRHVLEDVESNEPLREP